MGACAYTISNSRTGQAVSGAVRRSLTESMSIGNCVLRNFDFDKGQFTSCCHFRNPKSLFPCRTCVLLPVAIKTASPGLGKDSVDIYSSS
ncbi:hypothetical protein V6N13_044013 [Hibiscus sabdariffa]